MEGPTAEQATSPSHAAPPAAAADAPEVEASDAEPPSGEICSNPPAEGNEQPQHVAGSTSSFQADGAASGLPNVPPVEIKLFVGRVPRTADENLLRPVFAEFGTVSEIAIIKDRATQMHKGSAFVRMASITQADAAIRALNNIKVLDPQLGALQVRYATGEAEKLGMTAESAYPGQDQAKLFVGSLPRNITEEEVRNLFVQCGAIDEVFIMKDSATGQGKGCAFVKFAYKEQAIHAIKTLSGVQQLPGAPRPLEVRFAESKKAQQPGTLPLAGVSPLGRPAIAGQTMLPYPAATPTSPSFANCNPRTAGPWKEYFTDEGRPYYHNEVISTTQWERPAEFDRQDVAGPPGANIFVFHVPNDWTQCDLQTNFQPFGQIVSARIATDKCTGRNKGYAFVSYANIQSAAQAVLQMNGFMAGSKRLKVSIKQNEEIYVQHLLANPQAAVAALPAQAPAAPFRGAQPAPAGYAAGTAAAAGSAGMFAPATQDLSPPADAYAGRYPNSVLSSHRYAPYGQNAHHARG